MMKKLLLTLLVFAVFAGCEGVGLSWAESDKVLQTAIDALAYAYPLVLLDATRHYVEKTTDGKSVLFRGLCPSGAEPRMPPVDDFPCFSALLDFFKEPVTEHVADFNRRLLSAQLPDAGARTIAPPAAGDVPRDIAVIRPHSTAKCASLGVSQDPDSDFDKRNPAIRERIPRPISLAQVGIRSVVPDSNSVYASRVSTALNELTAKGPEVSDPTDQREPEDDMSVENGILFKPENQRGAATGFDIREDIERGQEFLKDKIAGHSEAVEEKRVVFFDRKGTRKERLTSKRIVRPNFLLAVEDLKDRKIKQVLITGRGCVTEGFRVTRIRDNGVASRFEVTYPGDMAVLALRTTVRSGKNGLKEVVYTPYSPVIDTWQVRKAGLDYLKGRIELARTDLMARKVRLAWVDGTVPADLSLVLSIIEHIDPGRFEHHVGDEVALVHEVLAVIGANTTSAYSYSKSSAGARGLFQFVPDTYRRLRERYRGAGLKKDFVSGCDDHINAAKASLLLFSSDLTNLPRKWMATAEKDDRSIGRYIAASYNCGLTRVGRSVRECKDQWTCSLPKETRIYLKKFDAVWNLRKMLDK
jgi:hypothetical protein